MRSSSQLRNATLRRRSGLGCILRAVSANRRTPSPPPAPATETAFERFVNGWRSMPASLVVLRLFLGVTFLYAGAQKLLDPGFFRASSPDYIGTQLAAFAQDSPISWLLDPLSGVPVFTGLAVALAEISIGLGTLVGIAPRTMAAGGFLVNLALLLSATWHVHPYFLGSDSVYAVAWAAYLIGCVEHARRSHSLGLIPTSPRGRHTSSSSAIRRRELLRGAALGGATLAVGVLARALSGTPAAGTLAATGTRSESPSPEPGGRSSGSPTSSVSGIPVAKLSTIPVGGAIGFSAPSGAPAALVRLGRNEVVAYSRVCTHAGCLVGYDASQRILYCPCHGAEYDPAHGAEVIAGPAPRPLPEIPVRIDPGTGEVVVPD
jgi:thiosulfate dehydrogenase (quinone) large subunit